MGRDCIVIIFVCFTGVPIPDEEDYADDMDVSEASKYLHS